MDRARKSELRALNERIWEGDKDVLSLGQSLDSSLKKNTAFIKRLRTAISAVTLSTFLQEICTLTLHKYLSEIISACFEGLCRLKTQGDIEAAVEIVSALHQRFGTAEFTEYLGWFLAKGLATPDKTFLRTLPPDAREREEKERLSRQRALLRMVVELWLVGVLRTLDSVSRPDDASKATASSAVGPIAVTKPSEPKSRNGPVSLSSRVAASSTIQAPEPFPLEVLKDLLYHDREHVNLPLLVVFVRSFGWDLLGVRTAGSSAPDGNNGRKTGAEEDGPQQKQSDLPSESEPSDRPIASQNLRDQFKNVIKNYFDDIREHMIRNQKVIFNQARRNAEAYVKSGEVFEDRQANHDRQVKSQERLVANAQIVADAIGAEMPDLRDIDDPLTDPNGSIGLVKTSEYLRTVTEGAGIWDDEEERRFYENLVDLKGKVPSMLLEDTKKKEVVDEHQQQLSKTVSEKEAETEPADVATNVAESNKNDGHCNGDDLSLVIGNKSIGAQVDALVSRLPDLVSKESIDQLAMDFCFVNSKASRNRLVKALTDPPRGRGDLLPAWSRLAATLGRYMPDIPKSLVEYLDGEFRSLQRRREKDFLGQVRLGNIRYLAELTKFGVVPEHVVFHCLKVSLDDFSRMNIEILCGLLENCGRYLLRNPDTAPRMSAFLETLQRKKSVQYLGQQERMLIENAIYHVDPPQRPATRQRDRTPIELFIRRLIYDDLSRRNYGKVLKQVRRLHWEEPEVVDVLRRVFSKPGKLKYGNVHLLAILLGSLYRYHSQFVVSVIDDIIESVCLGLEHNDFRLYRRRLAEVKYLSELYNYRMLEHPVIFDTLYRILTFGYGGPPVPGRLNPYDLPDDFFRVRLACTMLETCGMFFNRGAAGNKLDYFLFYFQYYIFTKSPLPMDVEFLVHDAFALIRPNWQLATNLEEAAKAFHASILEDQKTMLSEEAVAESSSEEDDNLDGDLADADEESSTEEEEEIVEYHDLESRSSADESGEEDVDLVMTRADGQADPEEVAEFEREFAKMMSESLESRKFDRKPQFDVPIPVRPKNRDLSTTSHPTESLQRDLKTQSSNDTMTFSLLTRKGNRQQTKAVELPSNSHFAVAMKNQQQIEREEQQRIKNLVLNYNLGDGEDTYGSDREASTQNGRHERSVRERGGHKARKLHLGDFDWT